MSYYFTVGFKGVNSRLDAYEFVHSFARKLASPECGKQHLEQLMPYFKDRTTNSLFSEQHTKNGLLREWLYHAFQVNAIYWPQYNLVAIQGNAWPQEMIDMLDFTHEFQNSCDQDYPYESWGDGCTFFDNERAIVMTLTDREIAFMAGMEEGDNDYDYFRQRILYDNIFTKLQLGEWLYGNPGNFEYISTSGVHTIEKHFELLTWAKAILLKEARI